ncbi:PE-PPE domain-containing protein [Thalassotalea piscium]
MNKIIEKYLIKYFGADLVADLRLIFGENVNLLNLINTQTIRHPDSEISFAKKLFVNKVKSVVSSHHLCTVENENNKVPRVLFINGMATPHAIAQHEANILSKAIGESVALLYNETDGLIHDLLECNQGRSGILTDISHRLVTAITTHLTSEEELLIVAYSQGAIIATSALEYLANSEETIDFSRIRYITIGAGFKSSLLPEALFCEHFANSEDPVTWLGLQNPEFPFSGELFVRPGKGHFFNADYIIPMMEGKSYGNSWFEQQIHMNHYQISSSILP